MAKDVKVGGEVMLPAKNTIEDAPSCRDHATLVSAVRAVGLVETLKGQRKG